MITRIWLRNFRRYVDEKITLGPGITFIDGQNNAGKSTVLYAIEYAFFGRVGTLKQMSSLMHPGARDVGVELRFTGKDGKRYILQRLHEKPPRSKTTVVMHFTLKVIDDDGERYVVSTDFQDKEEALALKLGEILGLSRRLFDVAVHVRQGEIARMLEGAPELDTVLGVTASVLAADEMRTMALEAEKEAATLPLLDGTLQRLRDDEKTGEARAAAFHADVKDIATAEAAAQKALRDAKDGLAALSSSQHLLQALTDATADVARRRDELARLKAAVVDDEGTLGARRGALVEDAAATATRRQQQELERGRLERRLGDLDGRIARRATLKADDGTCETCGQAVDHTHAHTELLAWQDEQQDVAAALDACRAGLDRDVTAAVNIVEDLAAVDDALQAIAAVGVAEAALVTPLAVLATAAAAVRAVVAVSDAAVPDEGLAEHVEATIAERRDALRDGLVRSETRLEALVARRTDLEQALAELQGRRREAARELATVAAEVERLRERAALAARLRRLAAAFKALQVTLRDQAAVELGREVFSLHQRLSAPDETLSGSSPGGDEYKSLSIDPARYVVNVTPHDIGTEVPAHLYQGGGHKVLLGLSFKLAVARRVGAVPFMLLDEPTYGLDEHRRQALLGRIAALDETTQMLFITHHDVGNVAGEHIRIVKKGKRSHVQQTTTAREPA